MPLVIFDFDGTLVDTAPAFAAAWEEVVGEERESSAVEQVQRVIAQETIYSSIIRRLLTEGTSSVEEASVDRLHSRIDRTFRELYPTHAKLYPGVYRLLMALEKQDGLVGVVGSSPPSLLKDMLDYFGLAGYVQYTHALTGAASEAPQTEADWITQTSGETAVWVSSRSAQLDMARAVGARPVYAAYGYGPSPERSSEDHLDHLSDLVRRL